MQISLDETVLPFNYAVDDPIVRNHYILHRWYLLMHYQYWHQSRLSETAQESVKNRFIIFAFLASTKLII